MADRKYLYTERAHYMCPNMHFGIMAESSVIREGVFIPPASPANRKAWGVLTINDKMRICSIHSM